MPWSTTILKPTPALLLGTLAVGVLDGAFALIRAALNGVPAQRVMQSIAAGLLGRPAYEGGVATALLGVLLHFFIAAIVVLTYFGASRRLPLLTRHPLRCGALYGLLVFGVMNFIVIPLSAVTLGPRTLARMLPGIIIHILGVGLPAALVAESVPTPAPSTRRRSIAA
jgi:hypothetical protein